MEGNQVIGWNVWSGPQLRPKRWPLQDLGLGAFHAAATGARRSASEGESHPSVAADFKGAVAGGRLRWVPSHPVPWPF